MIKVSKTKAMGKFLYINLSGFKDEDEQELLYKKIQQLIKDSSGRIKVYWWKIYFQTKVMYQEWRTMNNTEFFNLIRSSIDWNIIPKQYTINIDPENHTISVEDNTTLHTITFTSESIEDQSENTDKEKGSASWQVLKLS